MLQSTSHSINQSNCSDSSVLTLGFTCNLGPWPSTTSGISVTWGHVDNIIAISDWDNSTCATLSFHSQWGEHEFNRTAILQVDMFYNVGTDAFAMMVLNHVCSQGFVEVLSAPILPSDGSPCEGVEYFICPYTVTELNQDTGLEVCTFSCPETARLSIRCNRGREGTCIICEFSAM